MEAGSSRGQFRDIAPAARSREGHAAAQNIITVEDLNDPEGCAWLNAPAIKIGVVAHDRAHGPVHVDISRAPDCVDPCQGQGLVREDGGGWQLEVPELPQEPPERSSVAAVHERSSSGTGTRIRDCRQ